MNEKDLRDKRSDRNKYLIHQLLTNPRYTFNDISLEMTNFPPRPTIQKDTQALEFIHRPQSKLALVDDQS